MEGLNEYAEKHNFIKSIAAKLDTPPGYVLIVFVALALILIYNGIGGLIMLIVFGFIYPAYMTLKAVKYEDQELLLRFGKYWGIIGLGVALHEIVKWFMPEFPFLGLITVVTTSFLARSKAAGAIFIYDSFVLSTLNKIESTIDSILTSIKEEVSKEKANLEDTNRKKEERKQ